MFASPCPHCSCSPVAFDPFESLAPAQCPACGKPCYPKLNQLGKEFYWTLAAEEGAPAWAQLGPSPRALPLFAPRNVGPDALADFCLSDDGELLFPEDEPPARRQAPDARPGAETLADVRLPPDTVADLDFQALAEGFALELPPEDEPPSVP